MRGNSFGKLFSITSFGESHGPALGVVIDGVPPKLEFSLDDLQKELDRRAPGKVAGTTNRKEGDKAQVLSGIFEGQTLGTPIAVVVHNTNQRSGDYDKLKSEYRPGHADETTMMKYGIRDHRGGGRSSGRETLARVIGGYFASLVIPEIKVKGIATQIGEYQSDQIGQDVELGKYNFPMGQDTEIQKYLLKLKADGESRGGKVTVLIDNLPKGLGEPAFDKLKAEFAKALLSIGACVSFEYGSGAVMADKLGSEVSQDRDNFGGIEGGISNGRQIQLRVSVKPTSTVGEKATEGRHDPCIVPRVVPVIESMIKMVLADHKLRQEAYHLWT